MAEMHTSFEFTTDWFSGRIPNWTKIFDEHIGESPRVLEIGCFEGRSTCWMIERLSRKHGGGEICCVDPWVGNDFRTRTLDMSKTEVLFNRNTALAKKLYPGVTIHPMKEYSVDALALLILQLPQSFDLIYIDGDHTSKAAITDLVMAHRLCKPDGVIIVDDYLWDFEGSVLNGPKPGVDAYTTIFSDEVEQIRFIPVYQVFLKKKGITPIRGARAQPG